MPTPSHDLARRFFAALSASEMPDDLVTEDVVVWTSSSGAKTGRAGYQVGLRMFGSVFDGGIAYTVDSLTAEEDRVAAEVHSAGALTDGQAFANTYMFLLRIRDGAIASVAEHFDPAPVREKIMPLLMAKMAPKP